MSTLLLHGLGAHRGQPFDLLHTVVEDVIAPDLRAHGASQLIGTPTDFTFDALAREAAAAVPPGDSAATLIGISMGAALALRIATAGLLPVRRLILIRPAFTDVAYPSHLDALTVTGDLLGRYDASEACERFARTASYRAVERVSRRSAAALLGNFAAPLAAERRVRFTSVPRNTSLNDDGIRRLQVPVLVIATPSDPIHPLAVAQSWRGALPGARLAVSVDRDADPAEFDDSIRTLVAGELAGR